MVRLICEPYAAGNYLQLYLSKVKKRFSDLRRLNKKKCCIRKMLSYTRYYVKKIN